MRQQAKPFTDSRTPEQRARHAEYLRREDAKARSRCNALRCWRFCRKRECRRRHGCSGDPHACFERHWRPLPEDVKVWFRAGIQARSDGLSPELAARAANAERARHLELMAKLACPTPAAAADEAADPPPGEPRLRGL